MGYRSEREERGRWMEERGRTGTRRRRKEQVKKAFEEGEGAGGQQRQRGKVGGKEACREVHVSYRVQQKGGKSG